MRALALLVALIPAAAIADAQSDYATVLAALEAQRAALAAHYRAARLSATRKAVLASAREAALRTIAAELIPAWLGTPWDFNGTTETPQQGRIACGYFVSTVLRHAGFRVERVRLAQQASERIALTLSQPVEIQRFRGSDPADVARAV